MNSITSNIITHKSKSKVPRQLQKNDFGFVKLIKHTKKPFEDNWPDNPYTYRDIQEHINQGNNYGVIGGIGDLIIIDADTVELSECVIKSLPITFTVKTTDGYHFYYYCKDIKKKIIFQREKKHFGELISSNTQVVGAGSIHPDSKKEYKVSKDVEIATISRDVVFWELRAFMEEGLHRGDKDDISILDVINKADISLRQVNDNWVGAHPVHGSDNGTNFNVNPSKNVWHCFRHGTGGGALSLIAVMENIIDCTEAKPGGLTGDKYIETCRIAKEKYGFDVKEKNRKNSQKKIPQGELLIRICEENINEYFTDQHGEPCVSLPIEDHFETYSVSDTNLRNWMAVLFRKKNHHPPNSNALKQALIQVEARCATSQQIELFNRVGMYKGVIYYDLTTRDWKGVKITSAGWEITELPPVFRRHKHQEAQVIPVKGGNPKSLLKFCNICEKDYCLFMVSVIAFFVPGIPHIIPNLDGMQGSGKSLTSRYIKNLVDPSKVMLMSSPKNLELVQMTAEKNWITSFDNISKISEWFSDFLCRGVTGEGYMKRGLFTNDDEFFRSYRRCFILNGIGSYAERPDLLDRSIMFEIPELKERQAEKEIELEWNQLLPEMLGGVFTTISKAIGILDKIKGHEAFRMSDFARWGAALAEALGYSRDEFFRKYKESIDRKWEDTADLNTLNGKILELLQDVSEWKGTYFDLLEEINPKSDRDKNLPSSPKKLSSELKRIAPLLVANGIEVIRPDKREAGTGRKTIILSRNDK